MRYKFYIDTKRIAKNGSEYWARKYVGEVEYTRREGDIVNKRRNIQRHIDSCTTHTFMPIKNQADDEIQTIFSEEEEIGCSLCSVVNAVLEIPRAKLLSARVKNNAFIVKYERNGVEKEVKQPLN